VTRWWFILLAVVLGWFTPAHAFAHTRAIAYDVGPSSEKVVSVAGITMDTSEGNSEDPLSLHKYLYANANPIDCTDPSGLESWEQFMGYEAEEAIEEEYTAMHPAEASAGFISYGTQQSFTRGGVLSYLKPDIFVSTPNNKRFLEIKPISTSGVAKGVAKIALDYARFRRAGYKPDKLWQPLEHILVTPSGEKIYVINVGGIVFYQDVKLVEVELLAAATITVPKDLLEYVYASQLEEALPVLIRVSQIIRFSLPAIEMDEIPM